MRKANYGEIPKSHETIRDKMIIYSAKIHTEFVSEIEKSKNVNKFSVTFDEWTSCANKRYISVILHSFSNFWNLGLVRINGSATSVNIIGLVTTKLESFGVNFFENVISIVTDGCNVMTRIGQMIAPISQQLCYAHAIQLAVLATLYKKKTIPVQEKIVNDSNDDEEEDDVLIFLNEKTKEFTLNDEIKPCLKRIRNIINIFRNSSKKNEILQSYVNEKFGKFCQLILDTPTRWNSLCDSLERFIELSPCIKKAFVDLELHFEISDQMLAYLKEVVGALKPVKLTVQTICKSNANLIIADLALLSLFKFLNNQNTGIADSISYWLSEEIGKRRAIMSDALNYLETGKTASEIRGFIWKEPPSKQQLIEFFENVLNDQSNTNHEDNCDIEMTEGNDCEEPADESSFADFGTFLENNLKKF